MGSYQDLVDYQYDAGFTSPAGNDPSATNSLFLGVFITLIPKVRSMCCCTIIMCLFIIHKFLLPAASQNNASFYDKLGSRNKSKVWQSGFCGKQRGNAQGWVYKILSGNECFFGSNQSTVFLNNIWWQLKMHIMYILVLDCRRHCWYFWRNWPEEKLRVQWISEISSRLSRVSRHWCNKIYW